MNAVASKKMVVSISLLLLSFTLLSCGGGGGNGGSESDEEAPIVTSVDPVPNDVSVLLGAAIAAFFRPEKAAADSHSTRRHCRPGRPDLYPRAIQG